MDTAIQVSASKIEQALIGGDLKLLSTEERLSYYKQVCESIGVNPLTKPFAYIVLNGKLTLYALKDCTDQLRSIHRVSILKVTPQQIGDLFVVTAEALNSEGRTDSSTGAVSVKGLQGDALANAMMKAECVPLDSEILTRAGWRTYDRLQVGEEVLAYDCARDETVWTALEAVNTYSDLQTINIYSDKRQFQMTCTPSHSWAVAKAPYRSSSTGSRAIRGPYANRMPDRMLVETLNIKTSHKIILAAPERNTIESVLSPVEAAILGWAVTDGTIQRRGTFVRVGICQSKEENFGHIRELVGSAVPSGVHEVVSAARARTFPMSGRTCDTKEQHWWYLPSQVGRDLLAKAGFQSRADLPNLAARLDHPSRSAMIQSMMLAEGDRHNVFANTDRYILDTFQILCTLEGIALGRETVKTDNCRTIRKKLTRHVAGHFLNTEANRAQAVWCPTTAYGTWVMRQNGRISITGNSKAKRRVTLSLCGLGMLDETEVSTLQEQGIAQSEVQPENSATSHQSAPQILPKSQRNTNPANPNVITEKQRKMLFAIQRSVNFSDADVKDEMTKLGLTCHRDAIPKARFQEVLDAIDPEFEFHKRSEGRSPRSVTDYEPGPDE